MANVDPETSISRLPYSKAILASLSNGDRLLEDAKGLLDFERYATAYALAVLAEEEYAKAFLLSLVQARAIPWTSDIRRALHDHICKQLVGMIMDYLSPDIDDFLRRHDPANREKQPRLFPSHVLDAIHVICHERIPREASGWWLDPAERPIDSNVRAVSKGYVDRQKQNAIYVLVGKTGDVLADPANITADAAREEIERTDRIGRLLKQYDGNPPDLPVGLDTEKLIALFRLLTGLMTREEFADHWWA